MSYFKEYMESTSSINLGAIANFEVINKIDEVIKLFEKLKELNDKINNENILKQIGKLFYSLELFLTKFYIKVDERNDKQICNLYTYFNIVKLIKQKELSQLILKSDLRNGYDSKEFAKKLQQNLEVLADSLSKILNTKISFRYINDKKKKDPTIYALFQIEL